MANDIEKTMTPEQRAELDRIRGLLRVRMRGHRRREEHSIRVAETAALLATEYGVDAFSALCAGLVHDWDKVLPDEELVARALRYGVPLQGSPMLALPLLHGPVAARELPELFPELDCAIFQAVGRHTIGALDMTPLDMVVFVADSIEPGRHGDHAGRLRSLVGKADLADLFFQSLSQGLVYVIATGRIVYPPAIEIYNRYATILKKGDS